MSHVSAVFGQIDSKEIIAVTSTITKTEVLETRIPDDRREMFSGVLRRRNVQVKDVTTRISDLSAEIRNYYQELKDSGQSPLPTVTTPDALHLATAIHFECEKFYTFDQNDDTSPSRPRRALIPLSGDVAGKYLLEICMPSADQPGLVV